VSTFMWRGKRRVSSCTDGRRLRPRTLKARTQTVQVSEDAYALLTLRALEYGVSNKALLEYMLRDLPAKPKRNGPVEKRRAIENRARRAA
jgi:hypothetical protein